MKAPKCRLCGKEHWGSCPEFVERKSAAPAKRKSDEKGSSSTAREADPEEREPSKEPREARASRDVRNQDAEAIGVGADPPTRPRSLVSRGERDQIPEDQGVQTIPPPTARLRHGGPTEWSSNTPVRGPQPWPVRWCSDAAHGRLSGPPLTHPDRASRTSEQSGGNVTHTRARVP